MNCGNCRFWAQRVGAFGLCELPRHIPQGYLHHNNPDQQAEIERRRSVSDVEEYANGSFVTSDLMGCSKFSGRPLED